MNLDRAGAPATEQSMVETWVNQSIREDLCSDISWACMEFSVTGFTTQGDDIVDVPALLASAYPGSMLKDIDMVRFSLGDGYNYSVLPEVDQRVEFDNFSDVSEGIPQVWSRTDEKIRLRPTPDTTGDANTYKVNVFGWRYLPDLTTGGSNPLTDRHPFLLEMSVTGRGLLYYGEYEKSVYFQQLYQREYQRAINVEKRRKSPAQLVMRPSVTAGKPTSPVAGWRTRRWPDYGWMS
tara:strand:+ start:2655 stop:3362 length:708 start_codon:yes stop_codon:yes gene_type:complete